MVSCVSTNTHCLIHNLNLNLQQPPRSFDLLPSHSAGSRGGLAMDAHLSHLGVYLPQLFIHSSLVLVEFSFPRLVYSFQSLSLGLGFKVTIGRQDSRLPYAKQCPSHLRQPYFL